MGIFTSSNNIISRHDLRMPAPHVGENYEYFSFTGIAVFDDLKGTGSEWERGRAIITADYSHLISEGKAIELKHWTVNTGLASISNKNHSVNTGWAIDEFDLSKRKNNLSGLHSAVIGGSLIINNEVAVRDIDAKIHRISYNVTILGKVVDFEDSFTPID